MVIPWDVFKDFWKFWIFWIFPVFLKKDRNNFWFRLPSKLLIVPQWNLVCSFVRVIPRDIFKDFWKFWFFWVLLFSQKTDRNIFLFRLPSKLLVVPQWNLVCRFVMVIPRDTFKDFWNLCIFLIFAVFPKKQIEIFGPAYYLNDLSQLYETWCAALLWQYLGKFSRIFQKKNIFLLFFEKQIAIFGPTCHLNNLSQVYETSYVASFWQYLRTFSRIFWKLRIFFDFWFFFFEKTDRNFRSAYHLHDLSLLNENWYFHLLCQYLGIFSWTCLNF